MSHFSLLVIQEKNGPGLDTMLEPYRASDEAYYGFADLQELVEEKFVRDPEGFASVDEMAERRYGLVRNEHSGRWGAKTPAETRWDWQQVGGRWSSMLRLKSGARVDSARAGLVDLSPDEKARAAALERWGANMGSGDPDWGAGPRLDNESVLAAYGDAGTYARACASLKTDAVITPDGRWHEPPNRGWFGPGGVEIADEARWNIAFHDSFLKDLDPACTLTVVDCHI